MPRHVALALALLVGTAAACPRPAIVPADVPLGGCPAVRLGACTARCAPSMTHLVLDHGGLIATARGLWAMSQALTAAGWRLEVRPGAAVPGVIVLARRGHDRMSLVVALDRPPHVEVTFAPG